MKSHRIFTIFLILILFVNCKNLFSQYTSWSEQNSGVTTELTSASITSFYINQWVCGFNGVVLRTTNNGINWINVSGNGIPNNVQLINIFGVDSNVALTTGNIGSNSYVYRTSNGGGSWTQVFSQSGGVINGIGFHTPNTGIMVGNPIAGRWSIWRTVNGGITWDSSGMYLPQASSETGWKNCLYHDLYVNSTWFGTNNSRIYYSTNLGTNWSIQSTSPEQNSSSIFFTNTYGFTGGNTLLHSTNSGNSWIQITAPGNGNITSITGIHNGAFLFIRNSDSVYNQNNTSYVAPSGIFRYMTIDRGLTNIGTVIAVRNNGGISHIDYVLLGINNLSAEIPESFSLDQNYPNPFNPTTSIKFSIVHAGLTYIKVYDSQGREIETLVNQIMNPGTYSVSFDASKLSSGVYFYRIISGGFTDTKKMVLIK